MSTTKTKTETKGAQLADDLADLFPLVPDSDRWGGYYNQASDPDDDSIDAWHEREARFLALVNAAPELLEACKFALDWLARIDGSGCKGTDILLANAPEGNHRNLGELRAAIAKAERGAK